MAGHGRAGSNRRQSRAVATGEKGANRAFRQLENTGGSERSETRHLVQRRTGDGAGGAVNGFGDHLPEIIGICDRVLVMREGHIEGEVGGPTGRAITQENIMTFAAGAAA